MKKKLIGLFIISLFVVPFLALSQANATINDLGVGFVDGTEGGGNAIVLGDRDPRSMATQIINTALTILGVLSVVIILLGGFKWMTAAGNEDKVNSAKKILGAGIIGLVIILAAWGIARFVLTQLTTVTK
jgi:hypothetical protein